MNNIRSSKMTNHSSGFGMLELIIAMALSLILMAGVMQIYVSNKMAYNTSEAMSRLQENARYAMYHMQKEIRMAGYADCAPSILNHLNPAGTGYDDTLFNLDEAVGGWEYSDSGGTGPGASYTISSLTPAGVSVGSWDDQDGSDLSVGLTDLVVPGTDVISLKSLGSVNGIAVKSNNNINSNSINTEGANNIPQGTILLITQDCYKADLFQKRNNANAASVSKGNGVNPGNVNASSLPELAGSNKWTTEYGPGAKFIAFSSTVYFIGMTDGIPSLYKASFNTGAVSDIELLVEGVENMQITYGEDTDGVEDGIANVYRTIDNIVAPEKISSVRISLLMRTIDEVAAEVDSSSTYNLTGHSTATATAVDPENDRHLRYVFTSTIKLRNKGSL